MADGTQPVDSVARRYVMLRPHLDERQRRPFLGAEAREFGRGGIKIVAAATGVHADTIARGVRELAAEAEPAVLGAGTRWRPEEPGGVGSGTVVAAQGFRGSGDRGDAMSLLLWTTKSTWEPGRSVDRARASGQ